MARNTRNKECEAPRPSTWEGHSVPGQGQACTDGSGQLALLTTLGVTVPPRRLRFGCLFPPISRTSLAVLQTLEWEIYLVVNHKYINFRH